MNAGRRPWAGGAGAMLVRLAAFAGLATFVTVHWAALVDPSPGGRLALCVAIALAGAAAIALLGRARVRGAPAAAAAVAIALAAVGLGLVAIGVPPRLLWPAAWGELAANLDFGLAGLAGDIEYPYREGNQWSRLALLAAAPVGLGLAAAVSFWPAEGPRRRAALSVAGLAILVGLYATAAAATSPGAPLLQGAVLLALVGAWLWLPRLRGREALAATALVVAAGAVAVPAAAQIRATDPWLDYRSWTLRGVEGTTYRWEHSYGPIDWPRDGTRMLSVRSETPHYWKTVVLDRFDGIRWTRSPESSAGVRDVSPQSPEVPPLGFDPRWMTEFAVTIDSLETEVVVGAGTPTRVLGVEDVASAPDGTTVTLANPLRSGDGYQVRAYVPDPAAEQMRRAPRSYPDELATYTRIDLPPERLEGGVRLEPATLIVPLRHALLRDSEGLERADRERLEGSVYGRMFALTRELTDGQPTTYDAVRAIQDHLLDEYSYSELPPQRTYPLDSFLFEDERGYCQQFSGAMALMLRMAGIPARVATGFAPGTREEDGGPFRVEDFDAHSWVEVYFSGIGWVTFDPTPPGAPVSAQQVPGQPTSELDRPASGDAPEGEPDDAAVALPAPGGGGSAGSSDRTGLVVVPAIVVGLLLAAAALIAARARGHRRLEPALATQAQLDELAAALDRFGWPTAGGTTLLALERRLHRSRRRASARYVGRLRASRYGGGAAAPPGPSARRALRRELASTRGLRGRLMALVVIPPGGPRVPRRARLTH